MTRFTWCPIALELFAQQIVKRGLEHERVRDLVVTEARDVARLLYVSVKIDQIDEHLFVALRLHIAAHQTDRCVRFAVAHDEPRA